MKQRTSTFTDAITLHVGACHKTIQPGETVDFDEPLGLDGTIETALGVHAALFSEPVSDMASADVDTPAHPLKTPARRSGRSLSPEAQSAPTEE